MAPQLSAIRRQVLALELMARIGAPGLADDIVPADMPLSDITTTARTSRSLDNNAVDLATAVPNAIGGSSSHR